MVMHVGGQGNATSISSAAYPLLAPAGAVGAPSYAFSSSPTQGMWDHGPGNIEFSIGGVGKVQINSVAGIEQTSDYSLNWLNANNIAAGGIDLSISRDAANTLAQKNGNTAQEFRVYAGNGSYVSPIKSVNETLTIASAATTDSATIIPAGSVIIACAVRVLTAIPTAANFTMTTATGGTTMSTAPVLVAANTTDKGTAGGVFYQSANTKVRITPNTTPGNTAGSVRLCIYYYDTVAPTT